MNRKKLYIKKTIKTILQLSVILFVSCTVGDDTPPAQINNFSISTNNKIFNWTAPGDSGDTGRATLYLLRFFTEMQVAEILGVPNLDGVPFIEIQDAVQSNFSEATQVPQFLAPQDAGSPELTAIPRLVLTGIGTNFYSIVANDETGNSSDPSNVLEVTSALVSANFTDTSPESCLGASASFGEFTGRTDGDEDDIVSDLLIGDPCLGRAYIFIGGGDITDDLENIDVSAADVTIIGNPADSFASSVSGVGSLTGSVSFEEFIIGAPDALGGTGQVFVFEGSEDIPSVIDITAGDEARFTITGEELGDRFGFVNTRRGSNSFFVGAPGALAERGKVYRFSSGDLNTQTNADQAAAIVIGESPGDQFGYSVIDGGEVNTSSPDEYVVGAPGIGRAYVFFNEGDIDLSMDLSNVVVISGSAAERFGEVVGGGFNIDGVIDTNNNNFDDENELIELADIEEEADVVVSAPGANDEAGSVFMYSNDDLNETFDNGTPLTFSLRINGISPGDRLGEGLVVIPDINPDTEARSRDTANVLVQVPNNADIAVGSPGREDGEVYIFFGELDISGEFSASEADMTILPSGGISSFGAELDNLLDVNDDDFFDFAIGGTSSSTLEY
ncbi:MAG: hypothetical protein ACR2NC_01265 [Thermodesulfobacteriota bacterium]